jgi:hypothetical protein
VNTLHQMPAESDPFRSAKLTTGSNKIRPICKE